MQQGKIGFWLLALVFMLVGQSTRAQQAAYNIVDLGSLGGGGAFATKINNKGQIVGSSYTADGRQHPFLYSNGVMLDLGDLTTGTASMVMGGASSINEQGQIVGLTTTGSGSNTQSVGFLYTNGKMQLFSSGTPYAINNLAQIAGSGPNGAFLYANGQYTALGSLNSGEESGANAINDQGQIVGYSGGGLDGHAVLWQNGQIQDLGFPTGYTSSSAIGINANGQIALTALNFSKSHYEAFLWQSGQLIDLGTMGMKNSTAYAINNSGVIVGDALNFGPGIPFVYQNGQMTNIFAGTSWTTGGARGINDAGLIVGGAVKSDGYHAFLAIPNFVSVSGTISLDGLVATAPAQSVTIEFRPADGSPVMTRTVSVVANGSYSVSGIPANVYTLSFKGAKWLRQNVENVNLNSGNVSNVSVTLPAGDANDDNRVDIGDFGLLVNAYGSDVSDPTSGYDVRADFACSGQVDVQSFGLLVNNYGSTGDL